MLPRPAHAEENADGNVANSSDDEKPEISAGEGAGQESLETGREKFEQYMRDSWALHDEAKAKGNAHFLEAFMTMNQKNETLV